MAERIASLYAEIGAKTEGFQSGAASVKNGLEDLSKRALHTTGVFNSDFRGALTSGVANMKTFGSSLLDQAEKAGLSTTEIQRMTGATGLWTETQTRAARASANVAAKAQELSLAVKNGSMSAREAGAAFRQYAASQEVASTSLVSLAKQAAVAAAVIAGVGMALKQVYDIGKQGAQLEYTALKFDRLSASIGTTSEVLLDDLTTATRGTLSQFEAMQMATDLMALGLVKTRAEAVRLATVSAGLGMNMNQLVLTLTNQTTMRFDALGVSVDGFKEKVEALKKTGMDANTAFKEAFLQQAEAQLARVGNAADTNAGKFMQFEAQVKNLGDAFKTLTADAISPTFLPMITAVVSGLNEIPRAIAEAKAAANENMMGNEKAAAIVSAVSQTSADIINRYHPAFMNASNEQSNALNDNADAAENAGRGTGNFQLAIQRTIPTLEEQEAELKRITDYYSDLIDMSMDMTDEYERYTSTNEDLNAAIEKQIGVIDELTSKRRVNQEELDREQAKLDELNGKLAENEEAHRRWAAETVFAFAQAKVAADGITEAEGEALITLGEGLGLISGEAAAAMRGVNTAFEDVNTGNIDEVMTAAAESMGLLTTKAAEAKGGVNTAIAGVDTTPAMRKIQDVFVPMDELGPNAEAAKARINQAMELIDTAPALKRLGEVETKLLELIKQTWLIRVNILPSWQGSWRGIGDTGGGGGFGQGELLEQGGLTGSSTLSYASDLLNQMPAEKNVRVNFTFAANGEAISMGALYDIFSSLQ